jgi:hypothetical protein
MLETIGGGRAPPFLRMITHSVRPSDGGQTLASPEAPSSCDTFFVPILEQDWSSSPIRRIHRPTSLDRSTPRCRRWTPSDAGSGTLLWPHQHAPRTDNFIGGLHSMRSRVVFGSELNIFFALDSRTGKRLFSFETGATIAAASITHRAHGRQHVAVFSGRDLLVFALPPESTAPCATRTPTFLQSSSKAMPVSALLRPSQS